jgi:16S rRNA processing protein RimM
MATPPDDTMVIGEIAGSFGVRGELKVQPLTDFPERFDDLSEILVGPERRPYRVERARRHSGRYILKLTGVDTPEAVDSLRGAELAVPRDQAIPLPEGHFYLEDIIGATVLDERGEEIGSIRDVLRTGSNEVFVVRGNGGERLIPVIADAIESLDVGNGRVVVRDWVLQPEL